MTCVLALAEVFRMRRNRRTLSLSVFMIGSDLPRLPMLSHSHCDSSFKKPKDSNTPSSSDENVLLHTSRWTPTLLDKLGVVISENSPEQIIKEWSLVTLSQSVLKDIETKVLKTSLCLRNMDFASVEELWERTRHNKNLVKLLQPDDFHDTIGHSHKSLLVPFLYDFFKITCSSYIAFYACMM